jgi:hypothetical protein
MRDIIISSPFGTYIKSKKATSVLGSFTLDKRPGRAGKIVQFIIDNVRHPVPGGWRNRIGLRNPGIGSIGYLSSQYTYSLVC